MGISIFLLECVGRKEQSGDRMSQRFLTDSSLQNVSINPKFFGKY